jgi:PAS domain S-box-containing protein
MTSYLTFRLKMIFGIAAIQALLLFVIGYNSMHYLRASNTDNLSDYAQDTARLMAALTKNDLLNNDLASLEHFLRETVDNTKIHYARIYGSQGLQARAGEPIGMDQSFHEDRRLDDVQDGLFDTRVIIKEAGRVIGGVEIGLSLDPSAVVFQAARERFLLLSSLLMALTTVFSSLLGHFLTRQLDALLKGAKFIGEGALGYQVPVIGNDELTRTAVMFNRMSTRLAKTVRELNQALDDAHRAEKELKEKEARLRAVLEGVIDGVVSIDENGRVESFNPAAEAMFGYSTEEVLGNSVGCLMPEPHRSQHDGHVRRYVETGRSHIIGVGQETEAQRKDGTIFPVELAVSEVWLGKRRLFTGILRDITLRKQNEAELRRYQEGLEQMVAERTRALREAQAELVSRAMESARGQWSAMVLHNIGNAITPAKVHLDSVDRQAALTASSYLQACCRELAAHRRALDHYANRDPRGRQVFDYLLALSGEIEHIGRQQDEVWTTIDQALDYVSQILTLQQSYAAREQEVCEATDLNRVIEDALRLQGPALEKRRIEVAKHLASDLPLLIIDKNRLLQVLINLIKNAYEAIDQAGSAEPSIIVTSFHDSNFLGFSVADSGIGIASEKLDRLFAFGASGKGSSGIGLYYCKMFVEANHGTLDITSAGIGRGAEVRVAFNLDDKTPDTTGCVPLTETPLTTVRETSYENGNTP